MTAPPPASFACTGCHARSETLPIPTRAAATTSWRSTVSRLRMNFRRRHRLHRAATGRRRRTSIRSPHLRRLCPRSDSPSTHPRKQVTATSATACACARVSKSLTGPSTSRTTKAAWVFPSVNAWTKDRKSAEIWRPKGTSTRATSTSPPLGRTSRRTRVPVTRDMKARTARQPARAPTLRTRPRMEATVVSIAESTASSVAPPGRARVHATLGGREAAVRQPARAPTLRSRPRMEATVVSIAESTASSVAPPGRARVHATLGGMEAAVRQPARAPTLRSRPRMEATVVSIAESTASSVAPPGRARVHATLGGREAAVRQPARAPTLRSRPRMEATVVSIAESTATSVAPPGRARVHAKMDGREAAVRRLQTLQPRRRIRARVEAPPTS